MEIGILRFLIMLFSSVGEEIGLCLGLRSICLGMEMLAIWTLYRMDKAESMPLPAYNDGFTLAVKFLAIVYGNMLAYGLNLHDALRRHGRVRLVPPSLLRPIPRARGAVLLAAILALV